MPREGIEPSWPCDRQILSLLRIPVPPPGRTANHAALPPRAAKGRIIADSMIAGNNGGAVVASSPVGGGRASLTLVRTTVTGNAGIGLKADGANTSMEIALTVSDATIAENGGAGVTAEGATTRVQVTRSTVARNVGPDFLNSAGLFLSGANNTLSGRGAADTLGTITPNPPQ